MSKRQSAMELLPISTGILASGDNLAERIAACADIQDGDIVAVSSKAVATVEGAAIDLSEIIVTAQAEEWAAKLVYGEKDERFRQAVLNETARMNGSVLPSCPQAMLTELVPVGFPHGSLLVPNAGLDASNIQEGYAIGWPHDPLASAIRIRTELQRVTGKQLGVLLTDSACRPRRIGVTAIALTVAGFQPLQDKVGEQDLFGRALHMTVEARADQLATAANFLMGNAAEGIPAVSIRGHGLTLTDTAEWVKGIAAEEDLFQGM